MRQRRRGSRPARVVAGPEVVCVHAVALHVDEARREDCRAELLDTARSSPRSGPRSARDPDGGRPGPRSTMMPSSTAIHPGSGDPGGHIASLAKVFVIEAADRGTEAPWS
jgi:hypothetical protein